MDKSVKASVVPEQIASVVPEQIVNPAPRAAAPVHILPPPEEPAADNVMDVKLALSTICLTITNGR